MAAATIGAVPVMVLYAFLNRHLPFLRSFSAAVDLTVGERIAAKIVRSVGPRPTRRPGVVQYRHELGFEKGGIEQEEERR